MTEDSTTSENAPSTLKTGRDNKGLFAAGNALGGRTKSVWSNQADVAERLLNKYTGEEIRALASDPARCAKELSSFQEMIIIQLANALNARGDSDMALERERLLDRHGGKPMQRVEQKVSLSLETEKALLEGRKRVAKDVIVDYSVVDVTGEE